MSIAIMHRCIDIHHRSRMRKTDTASGCSVVSSEGECIYYTLQLENEQFPFDTISGELKVISFFFVGSVGMENPN